MNKLTLEHFSQLDKIANLYLNKYDKVLRGDKYYNEQKRKIDELIKNCNNGMIRRNEEKNSIINRIQGGNNGRGGANFGNQGGSFTGPGKWGGY